MTATAKSKQVLTLDEATSLLQNVGLGNESFADLDRLESEKIEEIKAGTEEKREQVRRHLTSTWDLIYSSVRERFLAHYEGKVIRVRVGGYVTADTTITRKSIHDLFHFKDIEFSTVAYRIGGGYTGNDTPRPKKVSLGEEQSFSIVLIAEVQSRGLQSTRGGVALYLSVDLRGRLQGMIKGTCHTHHRHHVTLEGPRISIMFGDRFSAVIINNEDDAWLMDDPSVSLAKSFVNFSEVLGPAREAYYD